MSFSPLWFEPAVACEKPSSAYRWLDGFSPGSPVFAHLLVNDRLNISEIFLKGP